MLSCSVAFAPQHPVAISLQCGWRALILASALLIAGCESETSDSPTAPTPVAAPTGAFEGFVSDVDSGRRLSEVRVEATGGTAAGRVTLTNGAGQFVFELPAGTSRFRWSKDGYVAHEAEYAVAAGSKTEVQIALRKTPSSSPFPPPPYTFTGLVTDSRGNPVSGAEVWIYSNSSPIDDRRGAGFTDASGRYTIVGERIAQAVRAQKAGYLSTDVSINPPASGTTFVTDLRIKRYERYTLIGPGVIKVGEDARLQADVGLDDGSRLTGFYFSTTSSSNPSVLFVDSAAYTGRIRGMAAGTATVTATFSGLSSSVQIRVDP